MASQHKSIRMDNDIRKLIAARMFADNCDESTAIKRLIQDGAKAPRPRSVVAQLAPVQDLQNFALLMARWHEDFMKVRSRLAMTLPDPSDLELNEQVKKWRKLAAELEPEARRLAAMASALVSALTGLPDSDWIKYKESKLNLHDNIMQTRKYLERKDLTPAQREGYEGSLKFYDTQSKVMGLFGI